MTSEGLGEMFEGDSADMCARKFPLMLMGGRAVLELMRTIFFLVDGAGQVRLMLSLVISPPKDQLSLISNIFLFSIAPCFVKIAGL